MKNNFILNSDYPIDKIIWLKEGEAKTDNFGSWQVEIKHELGCVPFVKGVWSIDDFKTAFTFGTQRQVGQFIADDSFAYSNDKIVKILGTTDPNKTVKYHVWAFANEDETMSINFKPTSEEGTDPFIFNSDFNYPSLFAEGYLKKGERFAHNLGYLPYCDVWQQFSGGENAGLWTTIFNQDLYRPDFIITRSAIALRSSGFTDKIYYRMYI